jgi:hypothetical protein
MSGEPVELNKLNEKSQFMNEQKTKDENNQVTCCRSKHTKNCCIATGVFGCIFLVLGKVYLNTSNNVYRFEKEYSIEIYSKSTRTGK